MEAERIAKRFQILEPVLNERLRRLFAAAEAISIGHGGITVVSEATGVSRRAITQGCKEIENLSQGDLSSQDIRKKGGGRKKATESQPELLPELEKLIEPYTRGDPESPLRWTCKSVRNLSEELRKKGFKASYNLVAQILKKAGYSLQANQKNLEGTSHPDRNLQFEYINNKVVEFQTQGNPVVSVDTKKKELAWITARHSRPNHYCL